ncbi:MAG: 6,7-dimethyl-8-ribityllumazine synthase [Alphaproteobacteria bacterium]|nr:6,7-dimethyl-8-ribityllumazine synthase [Alphaproteobacteria bacterium]MBE8219801.1 6,7-dimethyl-8-ribityllumazine synthase [Alphaproteobacteria bacterium]
MAQKILIVEARFYPAMADALAQGAIAAIEEAGASYDRLAVPGVLELPYAIKSASTIAGENHYDAYVALGVVMRGETSHYDVVCNESARGLMDLGLQYNLAIGNGIQTVEDEAQAWARCKPDDKDKGGGAAHAALALLDYQTKLRIMTGA